MRTAGIRGDERRRGVTTTKRRRGADVAPDLVHRVFRSERPNALRVSDLTYVRTTEGMADVSLVDATSRMIVGWQVASEMTVQTVLSLLEVARLRRGAFHAGLSFSLDRAHSDAGSQYRRPRGHAPGRDRRGSLRRATGRATTPHAGEPERLLSSRAHRRPGTRGLQGRLSPRGCDRVVVPVVVETRIQGSLGDPLSETGAHDFERAFATDDHTTSEEGIHGTESRGKPG